MKKIVSVAAAALLAGTALMATGCGSNVDSNNPQTLEVYVCNLGYGYTWAEKMLNDFAEEDWVKEKYPDLQVSFRQDAVEQNSKNWLENNSTNYDVIMCTNLESYLGASEGKTVDLTELVYNKTVPGENVTFAEKMFDSVLESNRDVNSTAEDPHYYTATFASGMTGIAYNATVLEALGFEEPNTTDELFAIAESIQTGTYVAGARGTYTVGTSIDRSVYSSTSAFVTYGVSAYINYTVETWWAQYEGVDNYINYFQGISDGVLSSGVTRQIGRRKALEATEEMMEYTRLYPSAERDAYRRAQNEVVMGQSLFMSNGDWFDMEERDFAENASGAGEVRLMNVPVLSSIREKATSIPDDATLALVVEAVDSGCNTIAEAEAMFPELAGKNIMVYYCTGQDKHFEPNCFFCTPSERNRVLGVMLYKSGARGFLHWGYNFYNSYLSLRKLDPYYETDGAGRYQAGDAFLVYPGRNAALPSLRLKVFADGMQDYKLLKAVEKVKGRRFVLDILEHFGYHDFSNYPHAGEALLRLHDELCRVLSAERESENGF